MTDRFGGLFEACDVDQATHPTFEPTGTAGLGIGGLCRSVVGLHLRPARSLAPTTSQTPIALSAPDQAFARTFAGTEPDGLLVNSGHDLALSPELIRRFEYHLTAVGERTQAQIRAAIEDDLSRELNEQGRQHAMRILDA